ncbi:MAG: helix-turn-helix domain-containing protein [Betaproteobacteria bacterium]|nr:helix-turn-helix domain-containing protein [Betaproteobacteria bacterium]
MKPQNEALSRPAHVAALEKIPTAARRMGVSPATVYRELKSGRLGPLVKLGERASAVPAESVDRWIADRIAESTTQQATKGGGRE